MDLKNLQRVINEALELNEDDMIQCVIKIKDIGNAYEYQELIEDNTDYLSQYDVDVEFQDEEEDPTIQFILAYHNPAEFVFYDENGEELDLEQPGNDDFPDDEQI